MSGGLHDKVKDFWEGGVSRSQSSFGAEEEGNLLDTSNSLSKALMGDVGALGDYYFPIGLIGGCCPRISGEEEDIVWNAAAEAADTERVHVVWQASGDKIWYLAVHSAEIASRPNTWCPFASLLPGLKDGVEPPTVYTFYSDETATMMTVMKDALYIHRGTSSVIRAKAERTSREFSNAPVIDLIPDRIEKLTPVPWYSVSLFEERARRILATISVILAVAFGAVALLIWFAAAMSTVTAHADLSDIRARSETKSLQLMQSVQSLRSSPLREQIAAFTDVNDGLLSLNGYLEMYVIKGGKAVWRAILPSNVTSERIKDLGAQTLDTNAQGTIIGNVPEAKTLGQAEGRR